jgi:hypothetical protein
MIKDDAYHTPTGLNINIMVVLLKSLRSCCLLVQAHLENVFKENICSESKL